MSTIFDWSDIPPWHGHYGDYVTDAGEIDWRTRCLHLAQAADALQLEASRHQDDDRALQEPGDTVFGHLESLHADYRQELRARSPVMDDRPPSCGAEVARIAPLILGILNGIRSDSAVAVLMAAVADAIHDHSAEVGEDDSDRASQARALAQTWHAASA